MKLVAAAPTRWPAPDVLEAWWRSRVGGLLDRLVDRPTDRAADGPAHGSADQPAAAGFRRTAGTGAAPGSRWEAVRPGERGGSAELVVTGTPGDRRLRATGRLSRDPGREAVLDVDGLDVPRRAETRSRLRHLAWHAVLTAQPARLLEARLELDWLLVVVSAAVRPRGAAEHLEVRLVVRGRGRWRPVLAPVLASVEGRLQRRADAVVRAVASAVATVADQPSPRPVPSSPTRRTAADASTPSTPPAPAGTRAAPRSTTRADSAEVTGAATNPQVNDLARRGDGPAGGLDLSWLASPVSTVSHLRAAVRGGRFRSVVSALRGWWTGSTGRP